MKIIPILLLIFLVSCSTEINETKVDQEKYSQALQELKNNTQNLDKRAITLEKQIDKLNDTEFSMANFVRIKIELDFLRMENYTPNKLNTLNNKFTKAFSEAEQEAKKEKDYSGYSLNDRYYSLQRDIEKLNQTELTVNKYLQIENELNKLEEEGYIKKRTTELRNSLLKSVLKEIEFAIVDHEIPEYEEPAPKITKDIPKEEKPKKVVVLEHGIIIHLINGGFDTENLEINVNDTVKWINVRDGRYKMALLMGNRECRDIKSGFFYPGETFNWTFTEPMTCYVSDGIFTTQAVKITIS